jgi:chromatin remodeling complex protein RSC6
MAKAPAPKAAPAAAPAETAKKPNALSQPMKPSADLAAIVGAGEISRGDVMKKTWDYIKKHNLQDAADKRSINADAKLKKVFGKDKVTMFEMTGLLGKQLTKV